MDSQNRRFWLIPALLLGWIASAFGQTPVPTAIMPMPVTQVLTPGPNTVGLVWIDGRPWSSDLSTRKIYRWDYADNSWKEWQTWPNRPGPLAWDGEGLWVVDESAKQLVRVDLELESLTTTAVVAIPEEALREVHSITGLTWDGEALWLATGCGLCSSLYRIDPNTGDILQSFFPSCEPRGLAFASGRAPSEGELWTVAYNGPHKPALMSRRVMTSDPSFVSSAQTFAAFGTDDGEIEPAVDPTAIAIHDGKYWVVDRATGKISQYFPRQLPP